MYHTCYSSRNKCIYTLHSRTPTLNINLHSHTPIATTPPHRRRRLHITTTISRCRHDRMSPSITNIGSLSPSSSSHPITDRDTWVTKRPWLKASSWSASMKVERSEDTKWIPLKCFTRSSGLSAPAKIDDPVDGGRNGERMRGGGGAGGGRDWIVGGRGCGWGRDIIGGTCGGDTRMGHGMREGREMMYVSGYE
jgi:hypothetical protein